MKTNETKSGIFGTSTWELDATGILTINGGKFANTDYLSPWKGIASDIKQIVITDTVEADKECSFLFKDMNNLTKIVGLSNLDTSNVIDMSSMFYGATSLIELDLSSFSTSAVINMSGMFGLTTSLRNLKLSSFDTRNVEDMERMFYGASTLKSLDLSMFDTHRVSSMSSMFQNMASLEILDLRDFETSGVKYMDNMLSGLSNLKTLYLTYFNTSEVSSMANMFDGDVMLKNLSLGENFIFKAGSNLNDIQITAQYTGKWQNIGSGTVEKPLGRWIFTSEELFEQYDGKTMSDTYVWQKNRVGG